MSTLRQILAAWFLASLAFVSHTQAADLSTWERIETSAPAAPTQVASLQMIVNDVSSSQSYVGPGDLVTFTSWLGFRAYSNSYAQSNGHIADLRGNSTGTFTINALTNGAFDAATATTDCTTGGNSFCFVTKMYDQTGGGKHVTQSNTSNQPGLNISPASLNLSGSGWVVGTVAAASYPVSLSAVAKRTTVDPLHFDEIISMEGTVNTGPHINWDEAANDACVNTGGSATACVGQTDNAFHAFNGVANGASTVLNIDGSENTAGSGTNGGPNTGLALGAAPTATQSGVMTGALSEGGFLNGTGFTSTQRTNLCHNMVTYWSISGASC